MFGKLERIGEEAAAPICLVAVMNYNKIKFLLPSWIICLQVFLSEEIKFSSVFLIKQR
jgi:hypothetical protein